MDEQANAAPDRALADTSVAERIARIVAGWRLSVNGEGWDGSAGRRVDQDWPDQLELARAILRGIREPDAIISAAGDGALWTRMIEAATEARDDIDLPGSAPPPTAVRDAGPPQAGQWTRADERLDASFPASDPPPAQPGVD